MLRRRVPAGASADPANRGAPPDPSRIASSKNGSSSAIAPSARPGPAPRVSVSARPTCRAWIAFWSSRSETKTRSRPSVVRTAQRSGAGSSALFAFRILNWCPQFVHFTVVPRPLMSASSNSYSALQRSHWTSMRGGWGARARNSRRGRRRYHARSRGVKPAMPRLPFAQAPAARLEPPPARTHDAVSTCPVNERPRLAPSTAISARRGSGARSGARRLLPFPPNP